jgi:hypothetical protein
MPTEPPVIDYRNPLHARHRDRVVQLLRAREALLRWKTAAMLAAGAALSFLGPLILAGIARYIQFQAGVREPTSWWLWFVLLSGTVIPLLYWLEHRTRGEFFTDAVRDAGLGENVGAGGLSTASRSEWEMQTAAATWAAYIEILLFAPRMTMNAFRQRRMRANLGHVDPVRPAEIIHLLRTTDSGVDPIALAKPGESMEDLWPALLWLSLHNWIGISRRQDRVWLLSDARGALGDVG